MSKDPNIEILKQKGFKKIVLEEMDFKYEESYHTLYINFSLSTPPTFNKLIVDVKDMFNVFINRFKSYGVETVEDYLNNNSNTNFYLYFITKKSENRSYTIYFENGNYFNSKGYNNVNLYINSYFTNLTNQIVINQDETEETIKKILNNTNVNKSEINFYLTKNNSYSISEPFTSTLGNEPFLQLKQTTKDKKDVKSKKDDKVYNYLLAYYLQHEKNNSNNNSNSDFLIDGI